MQSAKIPIIKTGWFYLWLIFMVAGIWGEHHGYLDPLESTNLMLWSKTDRANTVQSKVVRVLDISFDLNGLNKLQQLSIKYPQATFALIGQYKEDFLEQLSQSENIGLADKSVLFSARNNTSVSSLSTQSSGIDKLLKTSFINPMRETTAIRWIASSQTKLALQPDSLASSSQVIWRGGSKYYPSFVGQVIINYEGSKLQQQAEASVTLSSENKLWVANHSYGIGYGGEVYVYGLIPEVTDYQQLISTQAVKENTIIVVDDLSIEHSDAVARTLASIINGEYLYSNLLILPFKYLLLLGLLFGIFRMRNISVRKQMAIFLFSIVIIFLLQYFFVKQHLWLPLSLILSLSTISWILQLGFHSETNLFIEQHHRRNELMAEAIPVFYNTQNIETLLPHLEQSHPDINLIDSVYQIAIEAEAHRNTSLAKRLHKWILGHNQRFSPSMERMAELMPSQNGESENKESELEQTLVIDPDGAKVTTQVSSILNVTNFGRYQVDGILGKGAMGVVFQGVDPKINRYVAIKTLLLSDELDGQSLVETKQRFFREAETAGNLSHANIVTIYDVGEEQQPNSNRTLGYIAMDLLTGAPLSEFIKKGKLLPPSLVYQLMIQITDALDYAHRQKVIHRDIKPANIIYDDDLQRGTLTDFGIAYMSDHSKTKTGTILGSPYYMSPEQILGVKIDGRSDIFSLGVTFYQLLSGHLPFTGESIASVAFHITKTKHESVKKWNKKLPSSAARITNKAMQKEADKRYQSMQEFKQALINALKRDYRKSPLS